MFTGTIYMYLENCLPVWLSYTDYLVPWTWAPNQVLGMYPSPSMRSLIPSSLCTFVLITVPQINESNSDTTTWLFSLWMLMNDPAVYFIDSIHRLINANWYVLTCRLEIYEHEKWKLTNLLRLGNAFPNCQEVLGSTLNRSLEWKIPRAILHILTGSEFY